MVQMTPGAVLDVLKLAVAIHFGFAHLDEDKQQKTRAYLRSKSAWALSKQTLAYVVLELQQAPGGAGLVSAIRNAQRVQGSDAVTRLDGMGRVVPRVLGLLQTHGGVLDTIAAEDAPGFRRLAQAVKSRDAHTVLRALARIPGAAPSLTWISSTVRRIAQVVTSDDLTAEEKAAVSAEEARRAATGIQQARLAESATDPLTPRGADAAGQRVSAETDALDVTSDEHAADPHSARAAVARAEVQSTGHATETGRKLGLSPEQEHAMIDTGQVLIAAGAGSGKTRVLAGKVVYHLRDKKEPARSLIATSFTRKSARELKERIQSYGGADVLDGAEGYVGTTHSVSMAVQRDYGPRNRPDIASDGLQRATVEIAIKQVQMNPTSGFAAPPSTTRPFLDELTPVTGAGGRGADRDRGTSRFWKEPANQWWNLGLKKIVDEKGNAAGVRQVATAISKWKGNLVSPSEAWKESGESPLAAVYAAYEWLKRNDAPWAGKQDKDDILTEGVRLLARNKGAREAVQHRFKTVLVDEAQDQNRAQNVLFGLVTGTHNPDTLQEYPDGRMTAKTYCKIGDDKQAIYSFRGANPEEFIRSSDLVDTGGKTGRFKTHMLQTNYRSGANIVEAAGKLIAHNSRQVPMVCVADPARRGNGSIYRVDVEDHQAGAEHAAEEIRSLVGGEGSTRGYGDFGVATRTNAEAYAYVMELMRRGIPFRSRVNPLRDRTAQALIRWMHLAQPSVGGEEQNDAVLRAHEVPGFMLDAEFGRRIQALSRQQREPSYLRVLQTSWNQVYEASQQWRNDKNVRAYVDAIETLREGNFSPVDLVNHVLELQGVGRGGGRSLIESLMDDIKSDAEAMAELTSELGSRPTDDDVRALAIAPVQPILSLLGAHEDVGGALAFVNKLQRAAQKIDRSGEESAHEPAVNVDTVHGWKGLETRHLFVPMAKGVFPHTKSMEDETELSEERRLGYVALTRGKDVVTVITPGKSHLGKPAGPSPFLDEACIAPLAQPVAPGEEQRAV